jgi:hypothetical protein
MPNLGLGLLLPQTGVINSGPGYPYTNEAVLTNQAVANGTYTRPIAPDDSTNIDGSFISFVTGTKTISNVPGDNEYNTFLGWYMYDSSLSDPGFPRYGEVTYFNIPQTFSTITSTKSFTVSGLETAVNGNYSRTTGLSTSFSKAGSNDITFPLNDPAWYIWDATNSFVTHYLNSQIITTGGWNYGTAAKITITGAAGVGSGVYTYTGTIQENGGSILQGPGSYSVRNYGTEIVYSNGPFLDTIMSTADGGFNWTSTAPCAQFTISGLTGGSGNGTYIFTQRSTDGVNEWTFSHTSNLDIFCTYDVSAGTWTIYELPSVGTILSKSGTSPVGTWTKNAGQTGTATGGSVVAMTATGVRPTPTISNIVNVSGPAPAPTITTSGG